MLVPHPQKQAAYNSSKAAVVKLTQSYVLWGEVGGPLWEPLYGGGTAG